MNSSAVRAPRSARPIIEARPTNTQILLGIALGLVTGGLASLCSATAVSGWYSKLDKPMWAPGGALFAPFQIVVFALMGLALSFLWASWAPAERKRVVMFWFGAQLVLNLAWSASFFVMHSASWGYGIALVQWCAIVALIWTGSRLSRMAFYFLVPLFLWATFTSSLNFAVLSFNVLRQEVHEMDLDKRNANSPIDPSIIVKKR